LAAAVFLLCALFAKEEAVLLPFVCAAWLVLARRTQGRSPIPVGRWVVVAAGVLLIYFVARGFTAAMTPANAPEYYRFTFEPGAIWNNLTEYADRSASFALGTIVLAALLLGRVPRADNARTRLLVLYGCAWLVMTMGFALFLPVRSDLYAAVPAVGAALIAAALVEELWTTSTSARRRYALGVAVVIPLLLSPVYWQRSQRMARQARFSSTAIADLIQLTRDLPDGSRVLIEDAAAGPKVATMSASFGAQLNAAYVLYSGRPLDLALTSDVPPDERIPASRAPTLRLAVVSGRLVPSGPAGR
jgi:hypothetical protein